MSSIGISLGEMHCSVRMMWRRINAVQLQRAIAGVYQIMPCSGWNYDSIVFIKASSELEAVFAVAHENNSLARFAAKELVCVRVNFKTDFTADRNTH